MRLTAGAVIVTDGDGLPAADLSGVIDARAQRALPGAVEQARMALGLGPRPSLAPAEAAPRRWLPAAPPERIGVFLCRCGGEIARTVDLEAVGRRVAELPRVEHVSEVEFACQPEGRDAIMERFQQADLDGAVLVACSCCALDQVCYSCTTQRMRCKEQLGVFAELEGLPLEFVNVREQCAFVHSGDPAAATAKAGDLASAAVGAMTVMPPTTAASGAAALARSITAVVDPLRCRGCEDCEIACGLDAIHVRGLDDERLAVVQAESCLGCGICMAACPAGAIQATDQSDAQVEARLEAMGDLTGLQIVFTCNWGAYSALEAAGADHTSYDPAVRVLRTMCAGRAHPGLVLRAFQRGAERVTVLTCGHDEDGGSRCHYETGNTRAHSSVQLAQEMIALLGIDPSRLQAVEMQPGQADLFLSAIGAGARGKAGDARRSGAGSRNGGDGGDGSEAAARNEAGEGTPGAQTEVSR